jgi:neutral ceramidase
MSRSKRNNWGKCLALFLGTTGAAAGATDSGSLRVGAARVDITATANPAQPPSDRYAHERLYVRAIVLDNGITRAALIGADLAGLGDAVWAAASKQIAEQLKCPVENIVISATHTHSGGMPGGRPGAPGGPGGPGGPAAQHPSPVVDSMVEAVRQAQAKLQPARVGFGTGFSYLNVNRDAISPETHLWTQAPNLDAPSDKTVAVLKFETPTGQPIAVYVNYAMHPINGYLVGFTSADFPGAMCRYVEQQYGDKIVVAFSQGASGDQNPLYMRPSTNALASRSGAEITGNVLVRESVEAPLRDGVVAAKPLDPKVRDTLERWMESEGQLLGEEVIRVMTGMSRTSGEVRIWGAQNMVTCPGRRRTNTGREGMAGTYVDGDPVNIRLGVLGIGDIALTTVDAEVYNFISQRMKKQSPMANTVMVTLANGGANSGYIPDDASFSHNSFQVLGSRLKPGCAETAIANGLTDLVGQYAR